MANSKNDKGIGAGVGIAAAAVAAAGAGYYFYFSDDAKRHRRLVSRWATNLKREVIRQAKNARDLERETVEAIVDRASAAYRGVKSIDAAHLAAAVGELKDNWEQIKRELQSAGQKSRQLAAGATRQARTVAHRVKRAASPRKRSAKG